LGCKANAVLELGCYDGKAIEFLPHEPAVYKGYDANYESALELAAEKWRDRPSYKFYYATTPDDMVLGAHERFDIAIAMETLEHVPPEIVAPYLIKIAQHLDGYFFVTVPNEKGPVFLAKWLGKRVFTNDEDPYSFRDVFNHVTGRLSSVERNEHKGFDYGVLIDELANYFDIVSISALPLSLLPPYLSFGVAIVARSKGSH